MQRGLFARRVRSWALGLRIGFGFGLRFGFRLVRRSSCRLNVVVEVLGLERFRYFGLFCRLLFRSLACASLAAAKAVTHPFTHNALVAHERVNGQLENSSVRDTGTIYNGEPLARSFHYESCASRVRTS